MARGVELRKALAAKFDDELRFFRGWIDKPKAVGSIVPTSSITARQEDGLGHQHGFRPSRPLELGPGTSAILKRGVKPDNLYCVEYSEDFVRHLRRNHPAPMNVIRGDAFDLDNTLGEARGLKFNSVVSGVPLLNFPVALRIRYMEHSRTHPTGRPVVQLTCPLSPVPPGKGGSTVEATPLRPARRPAGPSCGSTAARGAPATRIDFRAACLYPSDAKRDSSGRWSVRGWYRKSSSSPARSRSGAYSGKTADVATGELAAQGARSRASRSPTIRCRSWTRIWRTRRASPAMR